MWWDRVQGHLRGGISASAHGSARHPWAWKYLGDYNGQRSGATLSFQSLTTRHDG